MGHSLEVSYYFNWNSLYCRVNIRHIFWGTSTLFKIVVLPEVLWAHSTSVKTFTSVTIMEMVMPRSPFYLFIFLKIFFDVDHFESLYQICYIIASVYILAFWHVGVLAPQPGTEPITLALEGEVLTSGPPGMNHVPF